MKPCAATELPHLETLIDISAAAFNQPNTGSNFQRGDQIYGSFGANMWRNLRFGAVVGPFTDHFKGISV